MTIAWTAAELAYGAVGPGAYPTGELRTLHAGDVSRLQHLWRGDFGEVWIDVPMVDVAELPPRMQVVCRE